MFSDDHKNIRDLERYDKTKKIETFYVHHTFSYSVT